LLRERRRRQALAGAEVVHDLTQEPGPAIAAAADHHAVGAGAIEGGLGVLERDDVAVGDDGNGDGVLDLADESPVGAPLVELAAGATVNGDHPDTARLGDLRKPGRIPVPL